MPPGTPQVSAAKPRQSRRTPESNPIRRNLRNRLAITTRHHRDGGRRSRPCGQAPPSPPARVMEREPALPSPCSRHDGRRGLGSFSSGDAMTRTLLTLCCLAACPSLPSTSCCRGPDHAEPDRPLSLTSPSRRSGQSTSRAGWRRARFSPNMIAAVRAGTAEALDLVHRPASRPRPDDRSGPPARGHDPAVNLGRLPRERQSDWASGPQGAYQAGNGLPQARIEPEFSHDPGSGRSPPFPSSISAPSAAGWVRRSTRP